MFVLTRRPDDPEAFLAKLDPTQAVEHCFHVAEDLSFRLGLKYDTEENLSVAIEALWRAVSTYRIDRGATIQTWAHLQIAGDLLKMWRPVRRERSALGFVWSLADWDKDPDGLLFAQSIEDELALEWLLFKIEPEITDMQLVALTVYAQEDAPTYSSVGRIIGRAPWTVKHYFKGIHEAAAELLPAWEGSAA